MNSDSCLNIHHLILWKQNHQDHSKYFQFTRLHIIKKEFCTIRFVIKTIHTFLKYEDNLHAQKLLHEIEQVLHKNAEEDNLEAVPLAVVTLLTTKKEKFMNMNDPKIKPLFGTCSFKTIQELVEVSTKM